ncbi:hypothetical protein [Lentisalinibacter orientalis]|uniref:hypothetical protein n=1 Tax=Lentisalinibacter orientalis TaxID=2992241 RepID=UPI00386BA365
MNQTSGFPGKQAAPRNARDFRSMAVTIRFDLVLAKLPTLVVVSLLYSALFGIREDAAA